MNDIYESGENISNISLLIKYMNNLTNQYYVQKVGGYAPLIYMFGKCYYFARGVKSVIPYAEIYITKDPLHVFLKIDNYFWDAEGMLLEGINYQTNDIFPVDLNDQEMMYFIDNSVANPYDDKYLLPLLYEIAQMADATVREDRKVKRKC